MGRRIILITGGQRSGKSRQAEELALSLTSNPVYVATAHIWDDEFRERVRKHQERRGPQWTNIEEEKYLSKHELTGRVVVIDCVTLWLTNWITPPPSPVPHPPEGGEMRQPTPSPLRRGSAAVPDVEQTLEVVKQEFDRFTSHDATYIFVTNEIGSGGVSNNALQRKFTDLEGWMNQYIASKADEVIFMVSGIAVKIK